jgi:hypothetical protein
MRQGRHSLYSLSREFQLAAKTVSHCDVHIEENYIFGSYRDDAWSDLKHLAATPKEAE